MRAIKVYCPPGVEPPLYAFIDALDGKLKATPMALATMLILSKITGWADARRTVSGLSRGMPGWIQGT